MTTAAARRRAAKTAAAEAPPEPAPKGTVTIHVPRQLQVPRPPNFLRFEGDEEGTGEVVDLADLDEESLDSLAREWRRLLFETAAWREKTRLRERAQKAAQKEAGLS